MQVPVSLTLCGLAVSPVIVTASVALRVPISVGLNATAMGQDELGARVGPHTPRIVKSAGSAPPILSLSESVWSHPLVTVTVLICTSVGSRAPYTSEVGAIVASMVPAPESAACCRLVAVLSLTVSVALRAPIAIVCVELCASPLPPASVPLHVPPVTAKSRLPANWSPVRKLCTNHSGRMLTNVRTIFLA